MHILLQLLVNTILTNALAPASGLVNVLVRTVYIRDRRLYAIGDVWPIGGDRTGSAAMSFEVSLSAGVREEGRVVYLKDINLVLNPDSPLLKATIPLPLSAPVDVDLGPDCRLETFVISDKHVWVKFRSVSVRVRE